MTGQELRDDALQNGFVLDCSSVGEHGFETVEELRQLIANADISTPEKLAAFERWQDEDGSKEGLLKLQAKTTA